MSCTVPVNYQTEQSPTSECESRSADNEIPHHLYDPKTLCQVHKNAPLFSNMNQIKSHYTYFECGLLSLTSSSQLSCSFTAITPRRATCPAHVIHLEYLFACLLPQTHSDRPDFHFDRITQTVCTVAMSSLLAKNLRRHCALLRHKTVKLMCRDSFEN